jgi:hypothetical protein
MAVRNAYLLIGELFLKLAFEFLQEGESHFWVEYHICHAHKGQDAIT